MIPLAPKKRPITYAPPPPALVAAIREELRPSCSFAESTRKDEEGAA